MRKPHISIFLILCLALLLSLSGCKGSAPSKAMLSSMVAEALLADEVYEHYGSECNGEGHKILGSSISGDRLKVYALTMSGNYGFRNDMFIKVTGTGVIPAVLTFETDGEDYKLLTMEYPGDGTDYGKSIRQMFPLPYRLAALYHDGGVYRDLVAQERSYAEEYLKSIGREAVIGDYSDLNAVLLTDLGVSVDVSNQLFNDRRLNRYPSWIGEAEFIENGMRYVRSLAYDEAARRIVYKTCEWETGAVIETYSFDAETGEEDTVSN